MQPITSVVLVAVVAWAAYVGPDFFSVEGSKNSNKNSSKFLNFDLYNIYYGIR